MPDLSARGAANPQTIRELMEAQKVAHPKGDFHDSWSEQRRCGGCNRYWPCDDHNRAVAALDLLDNALRASDGDRNWWLADTELGTHRLVVDPDTHCRSEVTDRVSVPDHPAPRGDADA